MSYVDVNVPVIEKITLPSGNTYFIADREIRDVVDTLSQAIAGGVAFVIAWDGTSTPVVANIPAGVVVTYNGTNYTGTLNGDLAQPGAFYLIKSATQAGGALDKYDEYVPVGETGSKTWEKIGDTTIDLSDVVTGVSLTKQTDTVIGTDATFTVTQPTINLGLEGVSGGTQVITGITGQPALNGQDSIPVLTGLGTPSTKNAIGANSTFTVTQPSVALTTDTAGGTGKVQVMTGASAAFGATDLVNAITGYSSPSTQTFITSATAGGAKLETTTITGVNGSTTASKATGGTSQTTATGAGTASSTNTDWLKGVSVSGGVLTLGAATMNTQTTTQYTFSDVTVPIATTATRVATGSTTANDQYGDNVLTSFVKTQDAALTGLGTPSTSQVPSVDTAIVVTPTTSYLKGSASGANVAWNSKDVVAAVTGYANPTTDDAATPDARVNINLVSERLTATASGANTAWNNKDSVTVLKSTTDVSVTKGT